jgi:SAM-dependent methyltransferase
MDGDARWLDSMPEVYDRALGPALFAPYAQDMAQRVAALGPEQVLELAAGTGILTRELAAALPAARLVATDLNGAMVAWAAARVPAADWRQADAQQLPLPDAAFDVVVCQFGAMFFPDRPRAYRESARVLAPGGTVLLTVWDRIERSRFPDALVRSLAAVLPDDPPDFVQRIPHGYADPDLISRELAAGGLRARTVERVRLTGTAPSAAAVAEGFCLGTPLRFALEARGPLPELTQAVADRMTALLGPGPLTGELTALVVSAGHPAEDRPAHPIG